MELQDILKGEIQKLQGDSPASTNAEERTLKIKRLLAQDEGLPFEITSQEVFHAKGASETELAHLAKKCNLYIHHVLAVWAQLPEYDEHLLQQTRRDLFPLLVQLRKHTLPLGNLASLATILYHCQQGQYQLAVQSYMQLSIGNVAWPIGVNVVGIHSTKCTVAYQHGKYE
ncbi:mRNA splicing protein PRP18 KNAG_0D03360 [Huiozyma naganishii CBS 8797]|uniref:Pre-mRNA-splicing factor 18 n=1 Tax=Huiozyma naganishii (strain ATCC MYA-139 / BCRC 22969 / CBS 8797 / KCTC 17520 / NBRC 10181 / NCYC 3082 / Yp74L-3) TaxID=1071383 RepID=J7RKQ6_HUIN7|nr:hypothetical protein KNAG_0D03360 [Kazachstania naganishii CBS 8797]CCK70083.1 hypothetical protein KNAG_0D03360 [Kazachstania naganishii CBS 8797]